MKAALLAFCAFGAAYACDADCVDKIAAGFTHNYRKVASRAHSKLAIQIQQDLLHGSSDEQVHSILRPINIRFEEALHEATAAAIASTCASIPAKNCVALPCGSACSGPISLVQHYDKLIAEIHAAMSTQWSHALATNSQAFAELEQAISERTAQPAAAAEGRSPTTKGSLRRRSLSRSAEPAPLSKLRQVVEGAARDGLQTACGPALEHCRFEQMMRPFILSFP